MIVEVKQISHCFIRFILARSILHMSVINSRTITTVHFCSKTGYNFNLEWEVEFDPLLLRREMMGEKNTHEILSIFNYLLYGHDLPLHMLVYKQSMVKFMVKHITNSKPDSKCVRSKISFNIQHLSNYFKGRLLYSIVYCRP